MLKLRSRFSSLQPWLGGEASQDSRERALVSYLSGLYHLLLTFVYSSNVFQNSPEVRQRIMLYNEHLETLDGLQQGFTLWNLKPVMPFGNPEYDTLCNQGVFMLPPQWLCYILFEAYFAYIAPTVPILDRREFMQSFSHQGERNNFSHLLVNAVLLAACRVCSHPCIRDADGSTQRLSSLFYQRAKALYDAEYESDKVRVVQALTLLGWYWEGPEGKLFESALRVVVFPP